MEIRPIDSAEFERFRQLLAVCVHQLEDLRHSIEVPPPPHRPMSEQQRQMAWRDHDYYLGQGEGIMAAITRLEEICSVLRITVTAGSSRPFAGPGH